MNFSRISGHQQQIAMLRQGIRAGRLAGAYLFIGPEGIGKFMVARAFARALICPSGDAEGCGRCPACLKDESGRHPDIHTIDSGYSEEITIEDIRVFQAHMGLRPYEAQAKVFLVNNAHMMNQVSANAFLKTLEEPARDSVIVLVTDKPNLLLSTISSRCRLVKFHPLPRRQLEEKLSREHGVASAALETLASLSDGRLGLAVRLKDSDYLRQKNRIIDVFTSGADPELEEMLASNRESLRWSLQVMISWFRDLYICKSASRAGYINSDRSPQIERSAAAVSFETLDRIIAALTESLRYNDHTINCKLLLAHLKLLLRQPAY